MSSYEQKNNENKLENLKNYFAEPKPGLVFITTLVLLNYKFWIIFFSEEKPREKISLIAIKFIQPIMLTEYNITIPFW